MKIKRIAGSTIVVKSDAKGFFEWRKPSQLFFHDEYVQALRTALNLVRLGYNNISISQYRECLHTHSELVTASTSFTSGSTDDEVIKMAYEASHMKQQNLHMLRTGSRLENSLGLTLWAMATEEATHCNNSM